MGAVGHSRAFAAFAAAGVIGLIAHMLIINPYAWALMRIASGLCIAGCYTVLESWLQAKVTNESDKTKIRNAATVIVVRNKQDNPSVLMGQRGMNAAFMPSKFVFPGGAVDDQDLSINIKKPLHLSDLS